MTVEGSEEVVGLDGSVALELLDGSVEAELVSMEGSVVTGSVGIDGAVTSVVLVRIVVPAVVVDGVVGVSPFLMIISDMAKPVPSRSNLFP